MKSKLTGARQGIARRSVLMGVILLLAIGSSLWMMVKWPWVKSLFRDDVENPTEVAQLREARLPQAKPADGVVGWPQWFGPQRDGHAPAGPLRTDWEQKPPRTLWQAPCGGGFGSFAVVGGRLYLHDREGGERTAARERLRCLDAENGQPLWEHAYSADYSKMDAGYANGPRTTPSVEGSRVYAVGAGGTLLCVEAPATPGDAPSEVWRHELLTEFEAPSPQWGVACSPLIEGELIIVQPGGKAGSVAAFDKHTGDLRWKAGDNPSGYSSPIAATLGDRRVILAMTGNALLALGTDGRILDTYPWVTDYNGNIATPLVVGDYVFISSGYNHGCALLRAIPNANGLKLETVYVRQNKVMRNHHSNSVYKDGFLYGFDMDHLKCVDFRQGREVEGWDASGIGKGCLILADRYLIVLSQTGKLAIVEAVPEEFRLLGEVEPGLTGRGQNWALPVLVDGRLYLRDQEKILCLDVR